MDRPRRALPQAGRDAVRRATTRRSPAARSAPRARCSRSSRPTPSRAYRVNLFGDEIESIHHFDPLTGEILDEIDHVAVWPASHYVDRGGHARARRRSRSSASSTSGSPGSRSAGKQLEAHRLRQRTQYDIEMLKELGFCLGDRELLADPRRPPAGLAAAHADRLLPRRLRRLRRRVAPDDPADSAACTRATARASRRWSTTASGCRRRWTTGR